MTLVTASRLIGATLAAAAFAAGAAARVNSVDERNGALPAKVLVVAEPDANAPKKPRPPINTIAEVFAALRACWVPPGLEQARPGMEITVRLSFTRTGAILGKPSITYETAAASEDERLAYRVALAEALRRCTPLPFTTALGNTLAGRPISMRFIDGRKLKQAERSQ